jgi:rhodanese-related sulfurtransferase
MRLQFIYVLFISFLFSSCQGQTPNAIQTVDVKTFSEKLKTTPNPQLLDVRTPEEFAVEHIQNAKNNNWNGTDFVSEASKLDKSKPVFVYCKVGGRSGQAASKLAELGFKEIYNLDGGILKWNATGMAKPSKEWFGISAQAFDELVKSNPKTIVNFYAKWCAPCKKMEPYILKMQAELQGKASLVRLDADENKSTLEAMKLDGLPVILIYENGVEKFKHIGYLSEEELREELKR